MAMSTGMLAVVVALLDVALASSANATANSAGSCQNYGCRHGYHSWMKCQCNSDCFRYNNCCGDFQAQCVKESSSAGSCQNYGCRRGYDSSMKCQCNSDCLRYKNCCGDFQAQCVKESSPAGPGAEGAVCPGSIGLNGFGTVEMTNAFWNKPYDPAGEVEVNNGVIIPRMKGRTYFSESCESGSFSQTRYAALNLLDKRISWTTDVSAAGCGCNAAFYLASLPQNSEVSGCKDFYCDANSVCGVRCSEIDLQEANKHAFHSVLHMAEDGSGKGLGYGGGGSGWNSHRDWTKEQYGPGSNCIDTTKPFQVEVSFPVKHQNGKTLLEAMVTKVSQDGCTLEASVQTDSYQFNGKSSADELTEAFKEGMTPIVSYWSAPDMLWMDGQGADHLGPCEVDQPDLCGEGVKFYDFSVESLPLPLRI